MAHAGNGHERWVGNTPLAAPHRHRCDSGKHPRAFSGINHYCPLVIDLCINNQPMQVLAGLHRPPGPGGGGGGGLYTIY